MAAGRSASFGGQQRIGAEAAAQAASRAADCSVSLIRSSPAVVVLAIAAASTINFAGPDVWRHLLVGRIVLDTGHLPLRDTFSYTAYGAVWRQHEWLAQTIMTLAWAAMGGPGLKLLKVACVAGAIVMLAAGMAETGAPARVQRPVLIVVALALGPVMQFRPELFTDLLMSLLAALMAAETYRGSRPLWVAVPSFALWSNLHGGFLVGLAAMGVYAAAATAVDLRTGRGIGRGARLAAITVVSAGATLLNPLGAGAWSTVMRIVGDPAVNAIGEWASLPAVLADNVERLSPAAVIYLVPCLLVIALAVFFVMTPATDDIALIAVAAMLAVAACEAVRNIPLAVIALAIPLTRHAGIVATRREKFPGAGLRIASDHGFNPLLAGALALILAWAGGIVSPGFKLGLDYPAGAVAFMREHRVHGNLLTRFRWGQYLTDHLGSESKVFIDERWNLVYPPKAMEDFLRFDRGQPGAAAALDNYPTNLVLIAPDSKSFRVMTNRGGWKIVYRDPIAVLFARDSFQLPPAADQPTTGAAQADFFP